MNKILVINADSGAKYKLGTIFEKKIIQIKLFLKQLLL